MLASQDYDSVFSFGLFLISMVGVAIMGREVVRSVASGNSGAYQAQRDLEARYGSWAVETAIAVCPRDDTGCIEREAKRLYESRLLRR